MSFPLVGESWPPHIRLPLTYHPVPDIASSATSACALDLARMASA